jgi:hypothetical protein
LSETKWAVQGRKKLREGYEIIWSGETAEKRNGIAIIVSPTYEEMATRSKCVSGRVLKIRIVVKEKEKNIL